MKRQKTVFILFLCITFNAFGMEQPKHVVVELDGILVEPDSNEAIKKLGGYLRLLWSKGLNAISLQTDFFAALKNIFDDTDTRDKVFWKGLEAPRAIWEFLIGKQSNQELATAVKEGIKKQKRKDEEIMLTLTDMTFNEEENASLYKPIPEGMQLLRDLHASGHTVHLVTNANKQVLHHLKKKFSAEFNHINGVQIISGEVGATKGPTLYAKFWEEAKITNPNHCVFIETEHDYAKFHSNAKAVVCANKDIRSLRQQLMEHGVLSQPVHQIMPRGHHRRNSSQTAISSSSHEVVVKAQ